MGEPTVEVKKENEVVAKKVKLEENAEADGAPDAKKVKLEVNAEADGAPDAKKVKLEENAEADVAPDSKKVKLEQEESAGVKPENGVKNGAEPKTAEEMGDPDLEKNVVEQIEYYFGNFNLPKDKFLQEQIKLEDGWVPLEVMLRFQRLIHLSKNPATIVSCLKNASTLMEVNEDGTKLRRSPSHPLPVMNEEWQKELDERTVYCKGFPVSDSSVSTYIQYFKQYGPVENIYLRKYHDKATKKSIFKGSANILFQTKELAEKFLALESVTYQDKELIRMTNAAHHEEKKKEKDERWGKKVKKDVPEEKNSKPKKEFAKGCILKINDITNEELTREDIKAALVDLGADVAFIQYQKGDKEALVRLQSLEDGAAGQFIKKLADSGDKVKFGAQEMELETAEGEEEEAFLQKTREYMDRSNKGPKRGRGHHRGHRGGFKGHHKRGRSPAKEGPAAKKGAVVE